MAQLIAPFPSDPQYGVEVEANSIKMVRTRTRPEAQEIAQQHINGSIKELFIPPEPTYFKRKSPKNHIQANVRLVTRSGDANNGEKEKTKSFLKMSSSQYNHVKPKVDSFAKRQQLPAQSSESHRVSKDFIEMNKRTAAATQPRIPRTHSINDLSTTDVIVQGSIGKIPKYLRVRQKELHEQKLKEEYSDPDKSIPDGHSVLPINEKLSTLKTLDESKRNLMAELLTLPITYHTIKQQQRKADIELKLREIEDAIIIFSRPTVYVRREH